MKVFMGFLLVCFFSGWLMNKVSLKIMALLLIGLSVMVTAGYFFLNLI
ncbi:hypothetical protein K2Z83_14180 [Oscillochloris sp. ZM17-4]|nr:hypothetical protein [Oscillochloris sp. ZM17-4]MBX0328823.1 hypothetical protein [Oscillochloris sp. ZM17-4]